MTSHASLLSCPKAARTTTTPAKAKYGRCGAGRLSPDLSERGPVTGGLMSTSPHRPARASAPCRRRL